MKRIFCLLLSVIISAGVTGCAETPANAGAAPQSPVSETTAAETDDSEEVVPVESIEIVVGDDEEVQQQSEDTTVSVAEEPSFDFESIEGTYDYKGFVFKGKYCKWFYFDNNGDVIYMSDEDFILDIESLNEEPGLSLYNAAFDIATLFYCNDVEGIKKYFDNEEDFNYYLGTNEMGERRPKVTIESPLPLITREIITGDDGFLFLMYIKVENFDPEDYSAPDIEIYLFLNEDNKWKTSSISFGK